MATAKKTASKKSGATGTTAKKSATKRTSTKTSAKTASKKSSTAKKVSPAKSTAKKASTAKKTASKGSSGSVKKGVKTSAATAKKTGVTRTNVTQYEQHKTASGKTERRKMNPAKAKGKKESLIKQKRSTGEGPACWPGFERVPGKEAGTKGSCKPKPNKSGGEKKQDARLKAGSKLSAAGGNKAKANASR